MRIGVLLVGFENINLKCDGRRPKNAPDIKLTDRDGIKN